LSTSALRGAYAGKRQRHALRLGGRLRQAPILESQRQREAGRLEALLGDQLGVALASGRRKPRYWSSPRENPPRQ